jgi:hypothetical protein
MLHWWVTQKTVGDFHPGSQVKITQFLIAGEFHPLLCTPIERERRVKMSISL